jgi:hypothetical protein
VRATGRFSGAVPQRTSVILGYSTMLAPMQYGVAEFVLVGMLGLIYRLGN